MLKEQRIQDPKIAIRIDTKKRLCGIGSKGETYDTIVNKLIDLWENQKI